jgi:tRNA A-37 threonylcarbamoyl transferase component Bud32
MITTCPARAELAGIGRGTDAGSCSPELSEHIEHCPECRKILERCARNELEADSFPAAGSTEPDGFPAIDGFTIERELGRGATAIVYLARRETPKRHVALKLWPGGKLAGARERHKWLREAEAASAVRHPNIVTLHEALVTSDWFLLALEYVSGGTLAERMREPLRPRAAARLVESIARAVHHIHLSGLVHLDLKPSNILLDGEIAAGWDAVVPKVSDFGIARSADPCATDTAAAGPGGTPSYMAPEQISKPRSEMTAAADIHGLGAILYHALTGRPPYQGATVLETIDQVRRLDPIPPRRLSPAISRDLETVCLKCLHKEPGRRYASAQALAEDLRRWLDGRAISARPVSIVEKSWRMCRRRPVVASLVAALVLTLSAGFASAILLWRRAEANFRTSTEIAGDLVDLVAGVALPKDVTFDRVMPMLEQLRKHLLTLAARRTDDSPIAHRLARVEDALAHSLAQAHRYGEAQTVLLDSLARLDTLVGRHSSDAILRDDLFRCLRRLADTSEMLGKSEESIVFLERLIHSVENELQFNPGAVWLSPLVEYRRDLAWLRYRLGDHDAARALVAENRRLLENPPACEGQALAGLRLLVAIDSAELQGGGPAITSSSPGDRESDALFPLSRLASPRDGSQSPEDWARLVTLALHCDDRDRLVAARREAENVLHVADRLTAMASLFRQLKDAEGPRRIAERILVLANHLVEAHPEQPASYLTLSRAYAQMYKNAYQVQDEASVEPNMRLARDAAQKALLLDPKNERAQYALEDLQRRLAALPKKG